MTQHHLHIHVAILIFSCVLLRFTKIFNKGLMKKLEEENKINSYMVSEKLPKELEAMRCRVQYLQKISAEPAMGQADVQELEEKVRTGSFKSPSRLLTLLNSTYPSAD